MTGFQVDNIVIEDGSGALYSDDVDASVDNNTMIPSGEVWEAQFYDYLNVKMLVLEPVVHGNGMNLV